MSKRLADTGRPSHRTCASIRCQPRGRTSIFAIVSFSRYSRPSGVVCSRRCRTTSRSAAWPRDDVRERRRERVLEVDHEAVRARVERVDHHARLGGAGDLDPAPLEIGGVGATRKSSGARRNVGARRIERGLTHLPRLEQRCTARAELALQPLDQRERLRREDLVHQRDGCGQGQRHCGRASATQGLRSTPTPSTSISQTSPSRR